ncbi:MAG: hypothetical protein KGI54_15515 [Pseudomonadota bacterium]|nr:hypothetical protein [Pseudomonadota bacterium]
MRKAILRFYLMVRKPRNFLKIVFVFIGSSLALHYLRGYDADWGGTNLTLSIDATIASTIMLMVQEESAAIQAKMLTALLDMAKAQRDMLADGLARDERILALLLKEKEGNNES